MKVLAFILILAGLIVLFMAVSGAASDFVPPGTLPCENCICALNVTTDTCTYCADNSSFNQAAFFVANYEQYDLEDCTKCRLAEEVGGIYPLASYSPGGVRYEDGQGHWILASCSEKMQYNLPLQGIVFFTDEDEDGLGTGVCPEPPTRETNECGFYKKEVYCSTDIFEDGIFEPTWNTLVQINVPVARSCGLGGNASICGNNVVDVGEECDDGNLFNLDGCSNNCKVGEGFGDGNNFRMILWLGGILLLIIILYLLWRLWLRHR